MDTADTLTRAVKAFPREDTPALMLVDVLMESTGATREQAEDFVRVIRSEALEVVELIEASELMKDGTPSAEYITSVIRRVFTGSPAQFASIVVEAGGEGPWHNLVATGATTARNRRHRTITVGARWILTTWAEKVNRDARHAAARNGSQPI